MNLIDIGCYSVGFGMLRGVIEWVVEVVWLVFKCFSYCGVGFEDFGKIG